MTAFVGGAPDFDLLTHGMNVAREAAEDLKGSDDDIMPVMLWVGPYGVGILPLTEMHDDDAKDELAIMMTTVLAVSRATEALQISTSWMVAQPIVEGSVGMLDMPASEHPDRREVVCLTYVSAEGDKIISAEVTRTQNQPPTLADWDEPFEGRMAGRFGDAMHMGLKFVEEMPPPLVKIIDDGWEAGEQEDLIQRFDSVFRSFLSQMDRLREAAGNVN